MNDTINISQPISHELLWDRFRAGDKEAFGKLALHYYQLLYNYGLNLNHDEDFVSDCIQELFLELWERRGFLSKTDFVKTYLLRALRNKIFKESIRLKRFQQPREVPFAAEADISIESRMVLNEEETAQMRQLTAALGTLTARQQEIIYLRFYQGLEFDEISHIMGLTRQSVANLLHRTLRKIKESWIVALMVSVIFLFLPA
ncbi:RNA polymerase sigma factor [Dyadobacter sp. Leaf189]|uniref:RNA polymerase sigma factor n=1 Tax=Dyadobacter sp. Leaf189 TaxID=1736295 RepID=UPI0006F7DE3F|nr:sigma-70 family RNA polymerase sigma factor [Dyadobacter sp. Leaf189]KQS27851.1 RNA polymerase subunit sigma-24 [Dyadobacter sp. Leaf189]